LGIRLLGPVTREIRSLSSGTTVDGFDARREGIGDPDEPALLRQRQARRHAGCCRRHVFIVTTRKSWSEAGGGSAGAYCRRAL
jgi:hypothetical protein